MAEGERRGGGERGEESVKLFVGQVPKQMTEEELRALFKEVALVDEVSIIKDKVTKASRGCCFLICPSREEADKAVAAYHNKRTLPGASSPMQVKYADGELERLEHKLFIGMIPKNASDADVAALFSKYGTIRDLQILRSSQQTSKAGCAFLKYETKEQSLAALEALNGKHRMEGSSVPLVVKWADTEKERQARRVQKAQSQASSLAHGNSMPQPSIFGALPMGYIPPYNGYGYQPPGTYGLMQYPLPSMQSQAAFHNMIPPINQGNTLRGVSSDVSPGTASRSFNTAQTGGFIGSPYPTLPGLQYPLSYPTTARHLGYSHVSGHPVNMKANLATPSGPSTTSGGQIEGPPGANLFIYHIPQDYGDEELSNAFQGFGRVLSAKVFVDKATGVSKCFGFVSYDSPAAAQAAISVMNGFQLGGKKLKVQHKFMTGKPEERDMINILVIPSLLMRLLHAQLWITLSRMKTAKGKHSIVDKSLDFEQVDRESNWDDQIILTAILAYVVNKVIPGASHLPWWNTRGVILMCLLHVGPVEFLYYWFHRALHHHYLYSRYHSHHHASVVTEPITSVIHPFAEELVYFLLFAIPPITTALTGSGSIITTYGYLNYIDFMNYMGHCNFEMVPKWLLDSLPPLKYLMYTPSFHSLHHTRFRTNYSLFMPIYDYIYGTVDESSDELHERSLRKKEEMVDVVHLTHLTTLQSMYHSRIGLSSLASKPYKHQWYLWIFWPFTHALVQLAWHIGTTFTVERNKLEKLRMETWMVPRYSFQYATFAEKEKINGLIEEAILEADKRGAKVLSLGLLNQGDELNGCGMLYVKRNPKLKVRIVDGTSLAVAVVLNSIPKGTQSVLLLVGNVSKMALSLCLALCQIDIQVEMVQRDKFNLLKQRLPPQLQNHLVLSGKYKSKTWLLGNGVSDQEQRKARGGIHFIPYSQFPPRVVREDCIYHCTPAMLVPKAYQNLHACENWLPRRVMSAWRVAGIVHALEQWNKNECGETVSNIETMWRAALRHGFLPYDGVL